MPDASLSSRIGPNAILQMVPVLTDAIGAEAAGALMARAGLHALPDGSEMIPETQAAHLHRQVRRDVPAGAAAIAARAGQGTADYILAHRIPRPAHVILKALPPGPAAWVLSRAIAKHAWTFAGSGAFRVVTPWVFEIADNPVIRGERADDPLCHWHAAVFERLYQVLVSPTATCRETACAACGDPVCRFELTR
jgi:divinyl protochlorophyllide a 8-vinyl-reductase